MSSFTINKRYLKESLFTMQQCHINNFEKIGTGELQVDRLFNTQYTSLFKVLLFNTTRVSAAEYIVNESSVTLNIHCKTYGIVPLISYATIFYVKLRLQYQMLSSDLNKRGITIFPLSKEFAILYI